MEKIGYIKNGILNDKQSRNLILYIAKYGNQYHYSFHTDGDVERFFNKNNYPFNSVINTCKAFTSPVPLLENFIPASAVIMTDQSIKTSIMNSDYGEMASIEGSGFTIIYGYQDQYEKAYSMIDKIIKNSDYQSIMEAITLGVTSVNTYLTFKSIEWNEKHPTDQLVDTKSSPVSFENKVKLWIPKMTHGKKFDTGGINWEKYLKLENFRNDKEIHIKTISLGITLEEVATLINDFKLGIAGNLVNLHILFGDKIPSKIIRGYFMPNVEVQEQ